MHYTHWLLLPLKQLKMYSSKINGCEKSTVSSEMDANYAMTNFAFKKKNWNVFFFK